MIHFLKSFAFIFAFILTGKFCYFTIGSISMFAAGKLMGYRFAQFSMWGICILRENGQIKVRTGKFTTYPSVSMFPPEDKTGTKVLLLESSTIFAGMAAAILGCWAMSGIESYNGRSFVTGALLVLVVMLIRHTINGLKMVRYLYGDSPEAAFYRESMRVRDLIDKGLRPRDVEFFCPEGGESFGNGKKVKHLMRWHYDLMRYYKALETGRYDEMSYYIKKMEDAIENVWIPSMTPFYYEVLYFYTAVMTDLYKAESYFKKIESVLRKDMDINGRRVYGAYLFYTGKDRNQALQAAREGLQAAGQFPSKGLAYMESALIMQLLDAMGETGENRIFS